MENHTNHEGLITGLQAQLQTILDSSEQAVYVYLDDEHKFCNRKFAQMLGYESADEWATTKGSFPTLFVAEKSHDTLIGAYRNAMQKMIGSTGQVTWKKKTGETVDSTVMLVPIAFQGELFALHYING